MVLRTQKTNCTAILTSVGTALAQNSARLSYIINNLGQNALFIKEGEGASATDFVKILPGGGSNDDGSGGSYESSETTCYTGIITVAGTSPRFNAVERMENNNSN